MVEARKAADRMEESSRKLVEVPIRLSDMSFPDVFEPGSRGGVDKTPQSSRAEVRQQVGDPGKSPINLESSPPAPMEEDTVPVVDDAERNRSLNEVFQEMDRPSEKGTPTIGSRVV